MMHKYQYSRQSCGRQDNKRLGAYNEESFPFQFNSHYKAGNATNGGGKMPRSLHIPSRRTWSYFQSSAFWCDYNLQSSPIPTPTTTVLLIRMHPRAAQICLLKKKNVVDSRQLKS